MSLTLMPPAMSRLTPRFDAAALLAAMRRAANLPSLPAGYPAEGHIAWQAMTLFSKAHGLAREAAAEPALRALIEDSGFTFKYARFMVLGPGGVIRRHRDAFLGKRTARLHLPIATNRNAFLFIGGERCCWGSGELWFGDFSRPHWGSNQGETDRIHLVMDVEMDAALAAAMENADAREWFAEKARQCPGPQDTGEFFLRRFCADFRLPAGFAVPGSGHPPLHSTTPAGIWLVGRELWLTLNGQPLQRLMPVTGDTLDLMGLPTPVRLYYEFAFDRPKAIALFEGGVPVHRILELD